MAAYGLGALFAPPLLGAAMDAVPRGMFFLLALVSASYVALMALRPRRDVTAGPGSP